VSRIKWTNDQLEAITESGCNLLVSAAAGAGKTAVLVERIIRKITDHENPVDIDKLLIVTFTNAAAAEMRERIGDSIVKKLDSHPDSSRLKRQIALLHKASITTIHSFCLDVIKRYYHLIDIDPDFRIADSNESALMKTEIIEELFEKKYLDENLDEGFLQLVECYGGNRDDKMLQEMVLNLYEFMQSCPWPKLWLKDKAEMFNLPEGYDLGRTPWAKMLIECLKVEIPGLLDMLKRAVSIVQNSEGLENYLPALNEDVKNFEALLDCLETAHSGAEPLWEGLYREFSEIEFRRFSRCSKDCDKVSQERVKALRNEVKERFRKIKEEIFISDSREAVNGLRALYPIISCLSGLVLEFEEMYAARKKEKSLMDFNDLEHFCLKILAEVDQERRIIPTRAALDLREHFEEILVDEYQDSNLVQEVILSIISRKDSESPNMFMVGDVKQSIYRFRQAKPELFLEKYNAYPDISGQRDRKIQLYKNFRSREEIINGVNFIFSQIMSKSIGELVYDGREALNYGCSFKPLDEKGARVAGGHIELHIIDAEGEPEERDDVSKSINASFEEVQQNNGEVEEEQLDLVQCEARLIIKKIKELTTPMEGNKAFVIYDRKLGTYRQVEYRDIVILLRTTKNWIDVFAEELGAQGVPVYADTGTGFFKTVEIQTIMSLLQIIDNPIQDIPLLSVLRSPIALFSPDELADIRLTDREVPFYEAMKKVALEDNEIGKKTGKFLETLDTWRDKALYMSTDELIWYLYTDTGYYSYVGAMPGGVQRQANLRMLLEKARQYEETSYKGLFNFINYINKLKVSGGDMGSARILGENANVVRIMSIHKSKGLEFPIVIVAGCGKQYNLQDLSKSILLHQDLGFGPDLVDLKRRISYPTIPKQALKYKIRLETLSEEMRILYVAFTRAKEKLIIIGTVRNIRNTAANWANCLATREVKLPEYKILRGRNYLDWVGPAVLRHKDCSLLRKLAMVDEEEGMLLEDESKWEIKVWSSKDFAAEKGAVGTSEKDFADWLAEINESDSDKGYYREVKRRLDWEYPYKVSITLPTKVSVTELKSRFAAELSEELFPQTVYGRSLIKRPLFLEGSRELTAAEKGTVLHFVMQHLDLKKVSGTEDIEKQIDKMVSDEMLTRQQAKAVDAKRIRRFFGSGIGRRMLEADRIFREVSFNIELDSMEVLGEKAFGRDTILLQGVIDCYFEENDGLVLIDYKTDYFDESNIDLIKERYRMQIDYYALALERLTGKKVKGKYIYLFWNGETLEY
jgi:ATP-dependent helicase/nuclease subunit A